MHGDRHRNAAFKGRNLDLGPRLAFVGGFEAQRWLALGPGSTLAGSTTGPTLATSALRGGQHDIGLVERRLQVASAVIAVGFEDVGPALTAIGGAVDATAVMGRVAESRDDHQIRIGGIDKDAVDLHGVLEPDVLPALAGIGRLPHAVTEAAADGVAGTGINDVGIGGCDLDGADAIGARLLIEDRKPRHTRARGLPDAAQWRAEVEGAGVPDDTGHGGNTAAVKGPHITPLEARIEVGIHLRPRDQG